MTLSNADCSFAKLGNSTDKLLDTETAQINVLAGGQVDGRWLGIQNQNGASEFLQRFALRPHGAYDPTEAMRFALEHQNLLVTGYIAGTTASPYPATSYSLLTVSDPSVLLWAVKPAEEGIGKGVIARFWNLADTPKEATITLTPGLASARRTTHIETDADPVPLTATGAVPARLARQQIQTYRLEVKR